nr:MAG TPA: Protein of unknown function (DUF559) [Caudoviricetes sp.]
MIKETFCRNCGKHFYTEFDNDGKHPKKYFCDQSCCDIFNSKDENKKYSICKNCKKSFQRKMYINGKYNRSEYCNKECYNEYFEREKRYIPPKGKCKYCNGEVEPRRKKNGQYWLPEYCCNEHFELAMQNKFPYKEKTEYICEICGTSFTVDTNPNTRKISIRKYCSDECRRIGFNIKKYKTLKEKYGDNLLPTISKINIEFSEKLNIYNIKYEFEYNMFGYFYDFYLPDYNILIEINPAFTHNSNKNFICKPVSKEYHYNKTKIANDNGYKCICIWDWDDKEAIIKAIVNNTLKIKQNLDIKKHLWNVKEKLHYINNNSINFNNNDWYVIYDDGQQISY